MSGSEDFGAFGGHARKQQRQIDILLGCRWWRRCKLCDKAAGIQWRAEITDPELKKNLRIFRWLTGCAVSMWERARRNGSHGRVGSTEWLQAHVSELTKLVTLPTDIPLTLKSLLGQRFELERLLVEIGDEEYLRTAAARFYYEREGTIVTWKGLFPGHPPPLLADLIRRYATASNATHIADGVSSAEQSKLGDMETTRQLLRMLIAAKEERDLPLRARRELKQKVLWLVLPVIVLATLLLGLAIARVEGGIDELVLAIAAGTTGAGLGGLLRLRDELNLGSQIREFVPFFFGEVIVGAAAGMLTLLAVRAGIIRLGGGTGGLAALSFVLGFSEAAFLGLVARVGGTFVGDRKGEDRLTES